MGYDVYYSGEVRVTPPLTNEHAALLQDLVNFRDTDATEAIFAAIAASPEPDLPGNGGLLEVSEYREYLIPETHESRHGIRLWLRLLGQYVFEPLKYTLEGEIFWEGEERDDCGGIYLKENKLEAVDDVISNPGASWAPNHFADDVLKKAVRDLIDSADSCGCSMDLTVVSAIRLEAVRSLLSKY